MTPERMAELVAHWVRFYTRDLPTPIAQRRVDEIDADLHDHIAHERANGISDRRIAFGIASRMVRGLAADVAWRGRQAKLAAHPSAPEDTVKTSKTLYRSAVRVALGVAFILSLPLVAMLITDDVVWSLADFVLAGVLLAVIGVALELAVRKRGISPPRSASPPSASPRPYSGRPMTRPASCSWASCSSSARVLSA
jgi:hypothetical protein